MSLNTTRKTMALAIGTAVAALSPMAMADTSVVNPFAATELSGGYMQLAEGTCGADHKKASEGKCGGAKAKGEGKCGGDKAKGEGKCGGDKAKGEGKCGGDKAKGEGKCGGDKAKGEGKCGEGKCGG